MLGSFITSAMTALPPIADAANKAGHHAHRSDASQGDIGDLLIVLAVLFFSFVLVVGLVFLIFRYVIRRGKALTAAMKGYASERSLVFEGDTRFPDATPLLRCGHSRRALGTVKGSLPGGFEGQLANYVYTVGSGDQQHTSYFSVVLVKLPEAGPLRIYCQRKAHRDMFAPVTDALTGYERIELESEDFARSFSLRVRDGSDQNAMRQLFTPSFIVYLSEQTPSGFWFELEDGVLCASIPGEHWERPAELDGLCQAAAAVAGRLREEAAEGSPPPPPPIDTGG